MAISTYTPSSAKFVHTTYVDMSNRAIAQPVHVVQYDSNLPVLAVKLYNEGQSYTLPTNALVSIRLGKSDGTIVCNYAEGCNSDRNMVYFAMTEQMATAYGNAKAVVEIDIGGEIASSSPISIMIDKNPVQEDTICSTSEYITAKEYAEIATEAANDAVSTVSVAAQYATNSANSANQSAQYATNSANSANQSAQYATNSANSANQSAQYATNSANSATQAKGYESGAKEAESNTKIYASRAAASATNAATSETNAKTYETAAETAATNAGVSSTNAGNYAKTAKSYAVGGTGYRSGEDTDNSKYYYELSKSYADKSSDSADAAKDTLEKSEDLYDEIEEKTDTFTEQYNTLLMISERTFAGPCNPEQRALALYSIDCGTPGNRMSDSYSVAVVNVGDVDPQSRLLYA